MLLFLQIFMYFHSEYTGLENTGTVLPVFPLNA